MRPERKHRPAGNRAATSSTAIKNNPTLAEETPVTTDAAKRGAWNAERRVRAAARAGSRTWPAYGSPEWHALPEESPLRWPGVLIAAEARARDGDELESTLRAEVELGAKAHKAAEDRAYAARRDAHRVEFGAMTLARGAFADTAEFRRPA